MFLSAILKKNLRSSQEHLNFFLKKKKRQALDLFDCKVCSAEDSLNEKHFKARLFALPANYRSYNKHADFFCCNWLDGS